MAKKRVEVEALLRWAYRDELPKEQAPGGAIVPGFRAGWGGVSKFGDYLTVIDEAGLNRWGVVPIAGAESEPHPDALAIAAAVAALDGLELGLPEDWSPFSDLGDMGVLGEAAVAATVDRLTVRDADGARRLRTPPSRLIFKFAIMGGCPVWKADKPEVRIVSAHGKPKWFVRKMITTSVSDTPYEVEADGYSQTAKRPVAGAYQKRYLDPCPVDAGVARGEYEIWRFAMDVLTDDLRGMLSEHEVLASPRAIRPWEQDERLPRVLPDLTWSCHVAKVVQRRGRGRPQKTA
ncbi:hypothetical protein [Methylocella tundrae]|uniref:Uncharacterized protein n=1 Tax=Methylocella tundrae TaxID=227605 RepID=A0A4U8YX74_METTU|nr:hypothetical protein [Methylocella tundrae]WPP05494.1 hypothetical protein SIN04_06630 [Methylocella tundrae]VFU07919.1 conserved protein of unknown function [Methylocella tundrae]